MDADGFYERNGEEIGFVTAVMSGEQDRIDIAQAAGTAVAGDRHQLYGRYPGTDGLGRTDGLPDRLGKSV